MIDNRTVEEQSYRVSVPSGTVTFLFTDIQGSTQLLERLREQYAIVLADQRELLRAAFAKWNGHEIDTQGDAFFVAFPRALDAVCCVIDAQRALATHQWTQGVTVSVRMGLHTGEPIIARTGYVGMDVHLAARIAAAGHGGQVLVSQTTRDLIYQDLPAGASLHDLGAHKLKDIRFSQPIYQLDIEGLRHEFPPLKTLATGEEPPTPGDTPFKGLQFFDEADEKLFFGREQITAQLAEDVSRSRFLAVIGASGSGKSSIIRAGLVPSLKHASRAGTPWDIHVITPTTHPLEALATTMTHNADSIIATATLMDDLARDSRSLHLFIRKTASHQAGRLLLIIDQFEELFTLCRNESERRAFVDNLLNVVDAQGGTTTVIVALRADFYSHLAQYDALRDQVAKHQEYIGPMNATELRQALEEPAKRGGWEFAPGLVDLMLHDVGADKDCQPEPGALPLLSHALLETWKRRRGNVMTLKSYSESGEVRGAIAKTAERVFNQELTPEQQTIARSVFLRLTELGEGTQDTRRRASFAELVPPAPFGSATQVEDVIVKLADARLITTGAGTVEVAHEALIREWPTLREWLTQNREGLRTHRHLTEAAQEWEMLERDAGALYRGARLAQTLEWAEQNPRELNAQERAFLDASKELAAREEAEKEAQRQRELQAAQKLAETERQRAEEQSRAATKLRQRAIYLGMAFGAAIILLIVAGGLAFFANQQTQKAQEQTQLATSRELAAASLNNLTIDPELGVLLALQAVSTTDTLEAQNALHRTIQSLHVLATYNRNEEYRWEDGSRFVKIGADNSIQVVDAATKQPLFTLPSNPNKSVVRSNLAPDAKHLAIWFNDNSVQIVDAVSGQSIVTTNDVDLTPSTSMLGGWRYSADGKFLGMSGMDPTGAIRVIQVRDTSTGKAVLTLTDAKEGPPGCNDPVGWFNFSPDGQRFATANFGGVGMAKVWDIATGKELLFLKGHTAAGVDIAYSPDGKRLVTTSNDNTAKIWDATTGKELFTLSGHTAWINIGNFSSDGTRVATASDDGVAKVWEVATGKELFTLVGHKTGVTIVNFSRDGKTLATGSYDGTVKLWDATTGREIQTLAGHKGTITLVYFSRDGKQLTSYSDDGTIKVWDTAPGRELATVSGHTGKIYDLILSPDGTRFATAGEDGFMNIWDAATHKLLMTFPEGAPTSSITSASFSPDGKRLVAGLMDGSLRMWNLDSKQEVLAFTPHATWVTAVTFSPDGKILATSSEDRTAKLWEAATGKKLVELNRPDEVWGVSFSPDGTRFATASWDKTVKVWDTATGKELMSVGAPSKFWSATYSPDGKRLAGGRDDGTTMIWDATTGKEQFTLPGHAGTIIDVAFNRSGSQLATASWDGTAKVWDVAAGRELLTLAGHTNNVWGVVFSPDGSRLTTASFDGTTRVQLLKIQDLVALAKSRVTRTLTTDECQRYLHMNKCP